MYYDRESPLKSNMLLKMIGLHLQARKQSDVQDIEQGVYLIVVNIVVKQGAHIVT